MVKKLARFLALIIAVFSLAGCSVHEDVMYSVAEINREVVSQWPYRKPGIQIHVRADNTKVAFRSSKVLGVPVETVTEPQHALIQRHTFYIAVKTEPGMNTSWDPTQLLLLYKNRRIEPMALSLVNLISYEAKCVSANAVPSAAIALYDDRYICLKVEFDVDSIYPSEQFGLELFGFYIAGKTQEPVIFGFRGSVLKSIKL